MNYIELERESIGLNVLYILKWLIFEFKNKFYKNNKIKNLSRLISLNFNTSLNLLNFILLILFNKRTNF